MEEEGKQVAVSIAMDMSNFEGVTVHSFEVMTQGDESRIDCIYVDFKQVLDGEEAAQGKVVARLNMSTKRLMELRDLLNKHTGYTAEGQ